MQKTIWDKYAEVLVDYSTNVQKDDLVQIRATSIYAKDLVKAIYKRVIQKGAHPILRTSFEDFSDIFIKYANDEQLDYIDPMIKLEYETVNKFISIGAPMNTKNMARADLSKLAKNVDETATIIKTCKTFKSISRFVKNFDGQNRKRRSKLGYCRCSDACSCARSENVF